jgi:SAM-dependent methyltransferase
MARVGHGPVEGLQDEFERVGRDLKDRILSVLPPDWSFDGRAVLDFGCGSGRVLRHFVAEAERSDGFWGSEIDAASVHWLQQALSPPFEVVLNGESPPIPAPDSRFDLIYAVSVFTHITHEWAAWALEMHRLLRPGGLLLFSYLGEGMSGRLLQRQWDEDGTGITIAGCGRPWQEGGPIAFMSPWWIEAHWGRAFEVVALEASSAAGEGAHDWALLRRREVEVSRADLERPADDPREFAAAARNVRILADELEQVRLSSAWWEAEAERLEKQLDVAYGSKSWRVTAPLRGLAERARRGDRPPDA